MTTFTPVVRAEWAPGFGPFDDLTAGSWQTLPVTFASARIDRGRGSRLDEFPPGTAAVVCADDSRLLDPLNTASAYDAFCVPDVPIRVVANHASTDHTRFQGYIDDYDTLFTVSAGQITLPSSDALRVLAGTPFPNPYQQALLDLGAVAWYKCDSVAGDTLVEHINGYDAETVVPAEIVDPLVVGSTAAVLFAGDAPPTGSVSAVAVIHRPGSDVLFAGTQWTVAFAMQCDEKPLVSNLEFVQCATTGFYIAVRADTSGNAVLRIFTTGGTIQATSSIDVCDGHPHRIVGVRDATVGYLYVDGVLAATHSDAGATAGLTSAETVDIGSDSSGTATLPFWTLDELIFFNTAFDAADVTTVDTAWTSTFGGGAVTGALITEVLDTVGWPSALRAIDTGEVVCQAPTTEGRSTLDVLQQIAATEGGRLFVSRDGKVTFHDAGRFTRETVETTSQATFTDTTSGVLYEAGIQFRKPFSEVIDRAAVTRIDGIEQVAIASGVTNPKHSRSFTDLLYQSDAAALGRAEQIVYHNSTPQTKVEGWATQPQVDGPSSWTALLGLEIGHRVSVDGTPLSTGTAIDIDQHLEAVSEEIGSTWRMRFAGSPTDPNAQVYFAFGGNGATQGWGTGVWR